MTLFGKELKKLRIDLGITLAEMANTVGISSAFLSAVENGRKKAPATLLDSLASNYKEVRDHKNRYEILINQARSEVVLQLNNPSYKDSSIATALARKFGTLTESDKDALLNILNNGERLNAN